MKTVTHILAATLVVASVVVSGAASAAVIDFDIRDEHGQVIKYPDQPEETSWDEAYASPGWTGWLDSPGTILPIHPELTGDSYAQIIFGQSMIARTGPMFNGFYPGNILIYILRVPSAVVDLDASWVEFDFGKRFSFHEMDDILGFGVSFYSISDDYGTVGEFMYMRDEFPELSGVITHVQLAYNVPNAPAVPEPETCAMLLAGLGIVGFFARRRRRLTPR
jgi:hypothetical protein